VEYFRALVCALWEISMHHYDWGIAGRVKRNTIPAALLCGGVALWPAAAAENKQIPNLVMDSQTSWMEVGDEYLPPPAGPGPITNDPNYPYVDNGAARRRGIQPTYRVADLSNPILQPWAREQMKKANDNVLAGKVPFRPRERCYPGGVPGYVVYSLVTPFYFLQTPKEVTIINQAGPEIRRVYLDVPHSNNPAPSWYGESVGHYENGDTLVVDTIGISTKSFVDNYRTPHTDKLHVVERFRIADGGKTLEDLITVEDPGAFTTPWSAMQRWRRVENRPLLEGICAENNFDFFGYEVAPLPHADKPDF
jgi:hypothetical protein